MHVHDWTSEALTTNTHVYWCRRCGVAFDDCNDPSTGRTFREEHVIDVRRRQEQLAAWQRQIDNIAKKVN